MPSSEDSSRAADDADSASTGVSSQAELLRLPYRRCRTQGHSHLCLWWGWVEMSERVQRERETEQKRSEGALLARQGRCGEVTFGTQFASQSLENKARQKRHDILLPISSRFFLFTNVCGTLLVLFGPFPHPLRPRTLLASSLRILENLDKMALALVSNRRNVLLVLAKDRGNLGRDAAAPRVLGHGPQHHRARRNDDAIANRNVAQDGRARRYQHTAAQLRVPVPALLTIPTKRHALHEDDVVAQLGRLADDHAGPAREVQRLIRLRGKGGVMRMLVGGRTQVRIKVKTFG